MRRSITIALAAALALSGCAALPLDELTGAQSTTLVQDVFAPRLASRSEGVALLIGNTAYYEGLSQNDLDFKMQKKDATLKEYVEFASDQVMDFTEEEAAYIAILLDEMAWTLDENGYTLPALDEVCFVKTTMLEEPEAAAYTSGKTIFLEADYLDALMAADGLEGEKNSREYALGLLWHEVFHCLTRNNPDFRADMYRLIHFTVEDEDYVLPPSVSEYHISNPDVEHHDSHADFEIDGEMVECFCDFVTTRHFEKEGDSFFDLSTTALVPTDGSDTFYTPEQAANFWDVFGRNTDYALDPEECMADNFALAMTYGKKGIDGAGYETPEIIDGIIEYLSAK